MADGLDRLLTVEEAVQAVLARSKPLPPRQLDLADAQGCRLAENVEADLDMPPFDKAMMDGFAVRTADLAEGRNRLVVGEEIPAGRTPQQPLGVGEAASIMTGAPLPPGADAVVMVERTRREGNEVILEGPPVRLGQHWMPRGQEMRKGDVVLDKGSILNEAALGLLASVGRSQVLAVPIPRISIVPTGDELVEAGVQPGPGQIRNSNAITLEALARSAGAEATRLRIAPDEPDVLADRLEEGLATADLLLITGGVSAGNRDLVPGVLQKLGVEQVFHKVQIKPGKPLWFGVGPAQTGAARPLVFGLPGNPVSGVVGFLVFVAPAIQALADRPGNPNRRERLPLRGPFEQKGPRPTYYPASLVESASTGTREIELLPSVGSSDLRTVARAEGFAVFPSGDRRYQPGEVVDFLRMG